MKFKNGKKICILVLIALVMFNIACKQPNVDLSKFNGSLQNVNKIALEMSDTLNFVHENEDKFHSAENDDEKNEILDKMSGKLNEDLSNFSRNLITNSLNGLSKEFTLKQYDLTLESVRNDLNDAEVTKETLQNDIQDLQSMIDNVDANSEKMTDEESNNYKNQANDLINQCNQKIAEMDKKAADEAAAIAKAEEEKKKKEEENKRKEEATTKSTQPKETQPSTQSGNKSKSDNDILANHGFSKGQTVHFKGVNGITGIIDGLSDWEKPEVRIRGLNINNIEWKTCSHGYQVPISCYECFTGSGGHAIYCSSDLDGNGIIESIEKDYYYIEGSGFFTFVSISEIY